MTKLEVPHESRYVIRDPWPDYLDHDENADAWIRAIARPVLIAWMDAWIKRLDDDLDNDVEDDRLTAEENKGYRFALRELRESLEQGS